ncbi:hypothetical protein CY652_18030 [Burkholderia sp. WAC0059]|nr:hypothetical protein CY652_18030 [Burkholderia sp. WAC0059]
MGVRYAAISQEVIEAHVVVKCEEQRGRGRALTIEQVRVVFVREVDERTINSFRYIAPSLNMIRMRRTVQVA